MDNITIFYDELNDKEHIIIDRGNGEFTSMPKAVWDAQEAAKQTGTISQDTYLKNRGQIWQERMTQQPSVGATMAPPMVSLLKD